MSTTTVMTPATAPVALPRGARWAAALAARLLQWLASLQPQPTVKPSSRSEEAAELRRYATRVARHDPRYAADLFAAADRHELAGE